jgi:3-oxoacyl-[acyl-carrier protein] reductase
VTAKELSVSSVVMDVSDGEAVESAVKGILSERGRIDVLVNNAGITRDNLLLRMKSEDWRAVMATNLDGLYYCSQAVLRPMIRQRSGRIINMSSVVGLTGNAGQSSYAASKAAIVGFTKALAREVASRDVTVNAVAPGYIETDMTRALPEASKKALIDSIPMQRIGRPEDVAAAVVFLASDAAGYITGQVLQVNGGLYM